MANGKAFRTTFEDAIFAAAFVDALRNIYDEWPMSERVMKSEREAGLVLEVWREHSSEGQRVRRG